MYNKLSQTSQQIKMAKTVTKTKQWKMLRVTVMIQITTLVESAELAQELPEGIFEKRAMKHEKAVRMAGERRYCSPDCSRLKLCRSLLTHFQGQILPGWTRTRLSRPSYSPWEGHLLHKESCSPLWLTY